MTALTNTPTQVRRPWRSTARTVFQALVGLAAIAPLIAAGVEEATGYDLDGVPFIVVALAAAAAVTRVMAVPGVEAWLRRFLPFLAAAPDSHPHGQGERGITTLGVLLLVLLVVVIVVLLTGQV